MNTEDDCDEEMDEFVANMREMIDSFVEQRVSDYKCGMTAGGMTAITLVLPVMKEQLVRWSRYTGGKWLTASELREALVASGEKTPEDGDGGDPIELLGLLRGVVTDEIAILCKVHEEESLWRIVGSPLEISALNSLGAIA